MTREATKSNGPMDRLKSEIGSLAGALGNRAVASVRNKVEGTAGRLTDYIEGGGGPGIMAAVAGAKGLAEGKSPFRSMLGAGMAGVKEKITGLFRKGKGGGQRKLKVTNIVESIDVGVPVKLAYNQWTQFSDFPKFTKKVENVDQPEEHRATWKAQVFWSHRTWESTILEQVPDERIIWRSKGKKGRVDGAVTFHELAPSLTRILVVLEYHPQGLFERTGNIWRAQGRRARLELKHFRRHMMTEGVLRADDIEGWRGVIHDGEVVESHEDVIAREEQDGSRRARNGRADAAKRRSGQTKALGSEREPDEDSSDESDHGRPARAPERGAASSRSRRSAGSAGSRSSESASRGNGRRQREGTSAQRAGTSAQRGGKR